MLWMKTLRHELLERRGVRGFLAKRIDCVNVDGGDDDGAVQSRQAGGGGGGGGGGGAVGAEVGEPPSPGSVGWGSVARSFEKVALRATPVVRADGARFGEVLVLEVGALACGICA